MQVVIKKWGNCAAVRLLAAVMKSANLKLDQPVEVEEHDGSITLRPTARGHRLRAALIAATPTLGRHPGWLGEDVCHEQEAFGE